MILASRELHSADRRRVLRGCQITGNPGFGGLDMTATEARLMRLAALAVSRNPAGWRFVRS